MKERFPSESEKEISWLRFVSSKAAFGLCCSFRRRREDEKPRRWVRYTSKDEMQPDGQSKGNI